MNYLQRAGFRAPEKFQQDYRCFSVRAKGRNDLEVGDKILLPESALRALTRQRVAYPMLFKLLNRESGRSTHCSVMEFSSDEGVCYMPLWMIDNLGLYDGAVVNVTNVELKKASYVKIQPHKTAFTEISNPKAVLEHRLRNFSCLTKGDTLSIEYNSEHFLIDVLEVKPDNKACIIETDCEVDFATPLDYKEPKKVFPPKKKAHVEAVAEGGAPKVPGEEEAKKKQKAEQEEELEPTFFTSGGYRLDGKPAAPSPQSKNQKAKPKPKSEAEIKKEEEEKAAYRKRFDEARKAVAAARALKFGRTTLANKHQKFGGEGHTLT